MLPKDSILKIGQQLVYQQAVGNVDISGEVWEKIFATSIDGINLSSPLGLADVIKDDFCWSVKTVKNKNPHKVKNVRIISGRNNVTYSYDIENPLADIKLTGEAVISIFNERLNLAISQYKGIRYSIFIRSEDLKTFTYFEKEAKPLNPNDFKWVKNKNGNLEAYDSNQNHTLTWQPNGSQFTIIYTIPEGALKFTLKKPEVLNFNEVIKVTGFNDDWLSIN